jgi:3-oxoacyl-[acyl-carrier-protein] synthase-1
MALDVVHWGGARGPAPAIVATSAWNGMGFTPHQIWAWRRAEMNAFAESPFLCRNGARAIMAFIRTLPLRAKGSERLRAIAAALLEPLLSRLDALPPSSRVGLALCLAERFADTAPPHLRKGRGELEAALLALLQARGRDVVPIVVCRGHAAFAHAILEANAALASHAVDAVVVGGVDTYYDPDVVELLLDVGRLFDGENLDSFIPGEGGAFCLVVRSDIASRCKWPVLARVESAASNEEPAHMATDLPCLGLGLSRPLRAIADRLRDENRDIDLWLGDLTNENYRQQEWMLAFPRASAGVSGPGATLQSLPVFLGDLGAATMPTAAVLAVESFLRGDPEASNCVLFGSSFGEHRGAVLLRNEAASPPTTRTRDSLVAIEASPMSAPASRRSSRMSIPPISIAPPSAPPASHLGARLGLISYASACAEATVHPERAAAAWAKYGLAGPAVEAEHRAWRTQFESYPEERAEFESHLEQFRKHWRAQ